MPHTGCSATTALSLSLAGCLLAGCVGTVAEYGPDGGGTQETGGTTGSPDARITRGDGGVPEAEAARGESGRSTGDGGAERAPNPEDAGGARSPDSGGAADGSGVDAAEPAPDAGGEVDSGGGPDAGRADAGDPPSEPEAGPPAGNPHGTCAVPPEASLEDTSSPDRVVGTGTPESCTSEAFIDAVAQGGIITFDCGPNPITITLDRPAKVFNDTGPEIVIDGGGLVTLSGGGTSRILYMNTCDPAQVWTTPHCQNQDHPRLTVQNLTFIDADSRGEDEFEGGGAIWVRGGRFKIVNSRFFNNVCADEGPDVGGAAVRVFSQFDGQPVYVVQSTFGGAEGFGNTCSNGGGISSIGVSWTVINSVFSHNRAIGNGGNPAMPGTPGGGSGGAIYNDGNTMTLSLCGTRIEHNEVVQHGSAIFFVSNDHTGDIRIDHSTITDNVGGSWYPRYPQISAHSDTPIIVTESVVE